MRGMAVKYMSFTRSPSHWRLLYAVTDRRVISLIKAETATSASEAERRTIRLNIGENLRLDQCSGMSLEQSAVRRLQRATE